MEGAAVGARAVKSMRKGWGPCAGEVDAGVAHMPWEASGVIALLSFGALATCSG